MSEIKVGDVVIVDSDGDDKNNFSGVGNVMGIYRDYIEVFPVASNHPDWTEEWPFGSYRVHPTHTASSLKPTNPKDAIGSDKLPLHLWPETATVMGTLGMLDGMLKYGRSNWRSAGIRTSIYIDAVKRHINAYAEGEDLDPDSGVPHLSHALACLAILVDAGAAGNLTDDRQYPGGYRKLVEELTPHVARLKAKHVDKDPHHYTIADTKEVGQ